MGARTAPQLPVAATVGRNIAALRQRHGWTLRQLETATERAGHRVNREAILEIERGIGQHGQPRGVTVDQMMVLAAVFRIAPARLLYPHLGMPDGSASARGQQTPPKMAPQRP